MINEKENYQIILAGKIHFPAILQLFETVIANSAARGLQTWNKIDECSLQLDIEKGNQYILTGDHGPAGVFTIQPEDRLIWKEMDNQKSLYLHRIAIAPDQKGKKLFDVILRWAIHFAKQRSLLSIRMDTWSDNQRLIDYYRQYGFTVVGTSTTADHQDLPLQNRNLTVVLLERLL